MDISGIFCRVGARIGGSPKYTNYRVSKVFANKLRISNIKMKNVLHRHKNPELLAFFAVLLGPATFFFCPNFIRVRQFSSSKDLPGDPQPFC